MKKLKWSIFVGISVFVAIVTFSAMNPALARHWIVVPYSFNGFGWGTELVVSNTSTKTINPIISVRNGPDTADEACTTIGPLEPGEIYINLISDITGWNRKPPTSGVFQLYVSANELDESDRPFGVGVEIYNASFGGYSSQQFMSEYVFGSLVCLHIIPIPTF